MIQEFHSCEMKLLLVILSINYSVSVIPKLKWFEHNLIEYEPIIWNINDSESTESLFLIVNVNDHK